MNIAIIKDDHVTNIIVADSIDTASAVTGIDAATMFPVDGIRCRIGQTFIDGALVPDEEPAPTALPNVTVSPVEFKLLWTIQERTTIKSLKVADPVVEDFYGIIDDPRLSMVNLSLASTQQAIDYLLAKLVDAGTITGDQVEVRRNDILSGKFI